MCPAIFSFHVVDLKTQTTMIMEDVLANEIGQAETLLLE